MLGQIRKSSARVGPELSKRCTIACRCWPTTPKRGPAWLGHIRLKLAAGTTKLPPIIFSCVSTPPDTERICPQSQARQASIPQASEEGAPGTHEPRLKHCVSPPMLHAFPIANAATPDDHKPRSAEHATMRYRLLVPATAEKTIHNERAGNARAKRPAQTSELRKGVCVCAQRARADSLAEMISIARALHNYSSARTHT